MEKIILHTVRYRNPETYEFEPDQLGAAVALALDGMFENWFAFKNITDEKGNEILSHQEIIEYAEENDI